MLIKFSLTPTPLLRRGDWKILAMIDIIYLKENGVDLVENSNPQRFILSAQFAGGFTELTEKEALEFIKDNKNAEKIAELTRNK